MNLSQIDYQFATFWSLPSRAGCQTGAARLCLVFHPLGRFAPVADDSGLRPETHIYLDILNGFEKMWNMKSKLFTKCPDIEKRTIRHRVWVNVEEDAGIKEAAAIRKLSVAEYMRRAALGRRADVRYEVDIVLQLSSIVRTIRAMHIDLVERGIETTAAGFRPVIEEAISAMLRIEGKGSLLYGSHSMEACSQ